MPPASGFRQVSRPGEDKKHHLQVLRPQRRLSSIQHKFKSFLMSLENQQWMRKGGCLIQFWTPTPTRKRKRLSISEHGKVCNKVYRYRYHCIQYANGLKDIDEGSFTWDYPEFSLKIGSYSAEESPHKNYGNDCGLQGYLALPIFEQWDDRHPQQRGSTGVLEILTCTENISLDATFLEKLKGVGLAIRCPPPCRKSEGCRGRSDMRVVGLYPLRDLYNLPLIQLWFPCICTLVQQLWKYNVEFGSANVQEFSYMDGVFSAIYCKIHRSACRTGCQGLGNGKEDPKVATVQEDGVQLCQIKNDQLGEASKAAKRLEHDQVQSHKLVNGKEDPKVATVQEDGVQHSQVKNRQFSEATKRLKNDQVQSHEALGSHGEKQWLSLSVQQSKSKTGTQCFPLSVQQLCSETTDDKKNPQGKTESSGEPASNIRKRKIRKIITRAMIEESFGRRLKDAAAELKVSSSTLKRSCRKYGIKNWPSVQMPSDELGDCGGKERECDSRPSPDHNSTEEQVTDANGPGNCNFDPSRYVTVKAGYDELGNCGGKEQECDSRPSLDHNSREKQVIDVNGPGNYNLDHNHSFTVKARYNECLVKFLFSTQSGIEALHEKLAMRFKLEVERIRIEYEDEDGDKVMISCDEDLSYHMNSLSSSGSTRMDLSVVPAL